MIPKFSIIGEEGNSYHCNSIIPVDSIKHKVEKYNIIWLNNPSTCRHFCKNKNCEVMKNLKELEDEYFKNIRCSLCETGRIEWGFFLIIHKLKKANLLPKNFTYLCCACYKEIGEIEWLLLLRE